MDEKSDGERLGYAIKSMRVGRGEPQNSLARRAGVTPAWLSLLEAGKIRNPTAVTVDAVAQALNFRDANDVLRWFYGHDGYARRRPRGFRRMPRQRPDEGLRDGQDGQGEGCAAAPKAAAGHRLHPLPKRERLRRPRRG